MVQEAAVSFAKDTPLKHQGRRNYLRLMLSEMINIVTSSPGLIAPKLLLLLDAMSAATGEVTVIVTFKISVINSLLLIHSRNYDR